MIELNIEEIKDRVSRDNFQKLLDEFNNNPFLRSSFKVYEAEVQKAETDWSYTHDLGFQPTDTYITYISNGSSIDIDYEKITSEKIFFDISGACRFRFVAGRFQGVGNE